jgi:hypothetical protein
MEQDLRSQLVSGARVKVTQQVAFRDRTWPATVAGTVVSFEQRPTGSWFAHSKDERLWLDRLTIRKDDGQVTVLNLDQYSRVEIVGQTPAPAPAQDGRS